MAEYNVEFVASAAKEFRSLPVDIKRRIGSLVESLHINPHPAGIRKLYGHKRLYNARNWGRVPISFSTFQIKNRKRS